MRKLQVDSEFDVSEAVRLPLLNQVDWKINPCRTAVLVHDMQRFFLNPFPKKIEKTFTDNTIALITLARNEGVPIAYSGQDGKMTLKDRGLMGDFWGSGMNNLSEQRRWIEGIDPEPAELLLIKKRYSAFYGTSLLPWLQSLNRDQLIICGVYSHVGILATALDAFTHDVQTFIVADATGDMTAELYRMGLKQAALTCAKIELLSTVSSALNKHPEVKTIK